MLIEDARVLVDEYIKESQIDIAPETQWTESRFQDGWALTGVIAFMAGAHHFSVLDTGEIHYDVGSLYPGYYAAKYSQLGDDVELEVINKRVGSSSALDDGAPDVREE